MTEDEAKTNPAILFIKPRAISQKDKKSLQVAGVVVIEVEDPQAVNFVRPRADLSGSELLACAAEAMTHNAWSEESKKQFGAAICKAILAKQPVKGTP